MLTRRTVLGGLGSLAAVLAAPPSVAHAATPRKRFLFVFNPGGWDPLAALAPMYGASGVEMAPESDRYRVGGLEIVDSPASSVRAFFERWHERAVVFHGLSVPSVSHEVCTRLSLTGRVGADRPDWASAIAASDPSAWAVPSLVVAGPSFPGVHGPASARVGVAGQLQGLLDGSILGQSDAELPSGFNPATTRLLDRFVRARAAARADFAAGGADARLATATHDAAGRVAALRAESADLSFAATFDLRGQLRLATDVLARGLSRCVSVSSGSYASWDTHAQNDDGQMPLFDGLFRDLDTLLARLASTPGDSGGSMLDETVVVVASEMGRTPLYNANLGRDHWPFTSVLLLGGGIAGDRVVGAYDDGFFGRPIDLASGEPSERGVVPTVEHLGATLLALAEVDPDPTLAGVPAVSAVLR